MVNCNECGSLNPDDAMSCRSCGSALVKGGIVCPACGKLNSCQGKYCRDCGAPLTGDASRPAPQSAQAEYAPQPEQANSNWYAAPEETAAAPKQNGGSAYMILWLAIPCTFVVLTVIAILLS